MCGVEDQGHDGAKRDRLYIILAHKQRTTQLFDVKEIYKAVCRSIRAYICTKPSDYCVAPPVEIQNEAMHLASVRGKQIGASWLHLLNMQILGSLIGVINTYLDYYILHM